MHLTYVDFIEPCFGIGHNLSLICQMTSEDIKHQLIIYSLILSGSDMGSNCVCEFWWNLDPCSYCLQGCGWSAFFFFLYFSVWVSLFAFVSAGNQDWRIIKTFSSQNISVKQHFPLPRRVKKEFRLDSNDYDFIWAGVSSMVSYKANVWYNLSCL